MTPVALYQALASIAPILLGAEIIWYAGFFALAWLLDYEPVKITWRPASRRGRIGTITALAAIGIVFIVFRQNTLPPATTITSRAVTIAALYALLVLLHFVGGCICIFELRRAIRLSRQQRRQQTSG